MTLNWHYVFNDKVNTSVLHFISKTVLQVEMWGLPFPVENTIPADCLKVNLNVTISEESNIYFVKYLYLLIKGTNQN